MKHRDEVRGADPLRFGERAQHGPLVVGEVLAIEGESYRLREAAKRVGKNPDVAKRS